MSNTPKHKPRKRFGQHFLSDEAVLANIIHAIAPSATDAMVEIGPGAGAMTDWLLSHLTHLHAVEIDRDLIALLQKKYTPEQLTLHESDVLRFDFGTLTQMAPIRVVGNLPYNISTPLLFHLFCYIDQIIDMHFMLQKEVVTRLCAQPNDKLYGRLSVMAQFYCHAESLFDIPPEAFDPPPKVDSAIIRLIPKQQRPDVDIHDLQRVVTAAFSQRRKTLGNNLKPIMSSDALKDLGIDPKQRAQELPVEKFVTIAQTTRSS